MGQYFLIECVIANDRKIEGYALTTVKPAISRTLVEIYIYILVLHFHCFTTKHVQMSLSSTRYNLIFFRGKRTYTGFRFTPVASASNRAHVQKRLAIFLTRRELLVAAASSDRQKVSQVTAKRTCKIEPLVPGGTKSSTPVRGVQAVSMVGSQAQSV